MTYHHYVKECSCSRCAARRVKAARRLRRALYASGLGPRELNAVGVHALEGVKALYVARMR